MHTYTTLSFVYWKCHSSNCPYHSLSITVFFLPLSVHCDSNKSLFITPGNFDVRPDPQLGSHPIQLEHINEKSCTIHPTSTEDDVPFSFPLTLQTLYLEQNILSRSVGSLAKTTIAVCVHLSQGRLIWLCRSPDNNSRWCVVMHCGGSRKYSTWPFFYYGQFVFGETAELCLLSKNNLTFWELHLKNSLNSPYRHHPYRNQSVVRSSNFQESCKPFCWLESHEIWHKTFCKRPSLLGDITLSICFKGARRQILLSLDWVAMHLFVNCRFETLSLHLLTPVTCTYWMVLP